MTSPSAPPAVLAVAGSDCSAGAGLQADLKTFQSFDVYGLTAVTCVVAEIPGHVTQIQAVQPDLLTEQLRVLFEGFPIAAVKTGMLYSAPHIEAVATFFEALPAAKRPPIIVDPVMVATSGDSLLLPDAVAAYRERLFPLATLLTPNLDETAVLLGTPGEKVTDAQSAAAKLVDIFGVPVLVKGGPQAGTPAPEACIDWLLRPGGHCYSVAAPFLPDVRTHGTGCTYSAAITASLARGEELEEAVRSAKAFVWNAIRSYHHWPDHDTDALNHRPSL